MQRYIVGLTIVAFRNNILIKVRANNDYYAVLGALRKYNKILAESYPEKSDLILNSWETEKERLLNSKVEELKNIFEKQRLDNLQNLTFLFESNNKRIELGDDEEDADTTGEPSGLVEK